MRALTSFLFSVVFLGAVASFAGCPDFSGKFQSELNKDKEYNVVEFRQNGCSSIDYVSRTFDSSGKQLKKYKGKMKTDGVAREDSSGILTTYELDKRGLVTVLKYGMNFEYCIKNSDGTKNCKWEERTFVATQTVVLDPSTKGLIETSSSGFEDEAQRDIVVLHYKRLK